MLALHFLFDLLGWCLDQGASMFAFPLLYIFPRTDVPDNRSEPHLNGLSNPCPGGTGIFQTHYTTGVHLKAAKRQRGRQGSIWGPSLVSNAGGCVTAPLPTWGCLIHPPAPEPTLPPSSACVCSTSQFTSQFS